ncbi:MAG TPA: riboflavin synthase [Thermoleophilia bacterium]|nr:riboflavin synthase [Thermoleophilia bacterium]
MFTGLVEEVGRIARVEKRSQGAHIYVHAAVVTEGTRVGDSIAVDGACLTVVHVEPKLFAVDCMAETLATTTIGARRAGDTVNLERAMALGERLGGHLVLGHVDGVGEVRSVHRRGIALEVTVRFPADLAPYVAPKGSVAVDGISLTVTEVHDDEFGLGIIPHSLQHTTLGDVVAGRRVNLEADVLARYVRQALLAAGDAGRPSGGTGRLSMNGLRSAGYLE